jgi:hypothetical protein
MLKIMVDKTTYFANTAFKEEMRKQPDLLMELLTL